MKLLTNSKTMIDSINSIGIYNSESLIEYLPYRYDIFNYTNEDNILNNDRVVLLGKIVSNIKYFKAAKIEIISFHFVSNSNHLYLIKAFNQGYLRNVLEYGEQFTLVGRYNAQKKEISLTTIKKGEIPPEERYRPVYHLPMEVSDANYRKLIKRTLEEYSMYINEVLPHFLILKYKLLSHERAINMVHFPKNEEELQSALRTLKFEECLEYSAKNKIIRNQNKMIAKKKNKEIDTFKINEFIKSLPYKLTSDQIQSIREIVLDMKKPSLMYRLLQGDVGTGKTLVASICLYANYLRDRQGVLMAPTDSLARQHYDNVKELFKDTDIEVGLLVGNMTKKEKTEIYNKLIEGKIDVLIGTHALFSSQCNYNSLGLAIIDEQHRFGVNQRNLLVNKGDEVDLLLMSATPIPRTLSLSIYGDLDVSTLSVFPNKKRNVKTVVVNYSSPKICGLIDYCLKNDKQVFLVCPKIISNENEDSSVNKIYEKYHEIYQEKIGLLHGKMKSEDKEKVLEMFKNKEISILVATSIVELGIDIKGASGIVVFSANSFGLASLHQLRGRVGRDGNEAFCLLVDDDNDNIERLKFLETCSDGFKIAEEDMRLRGPGDFIGLEQSGFPSFNTLNIVSDFRMFEIARDEVQNILNNLDNEENKKYYDRILNILKEQEKEEIVKLFD